MDISFQNIVCEGTEKIRLRKYLLNLFPLLPTNSSVKKAIKRNQIFVDGKTADNETFVEHGQKIEFILKKNENAKIYNLEFDVIYEDDYFAIINKPSGISVSDKKFRTIENSLAKKLKISTQKDALQQFRPIHRLDNQTSGLLLIAKTSNALVEIGKLFYKREILKRYRAIVTGNLPDKGEIISDINGKFAKTIYKKVKSVKSIKNKELTLVDLFPHTGRTHQLRIHLSGIGNPVLGDKLYGKQGLILKNKGLFLCAVELCFNHFVTKEPICIKINEPHKFEKILRIEGNRYQKYFGLD
jgi:RluA family pseudouridine synthase